MNRNNIGTISQIFANNHCEQMNVCSGCGMFKLENPSRVVPTKESDITLFFYCIAASSHNNIALLTFYKKELGAIRLPIPVYQYNRIQY